MEKTLVTLCILKGVIIINSVLAIFTLILLANLTLISTIIILEKKRPEKTISWILILIFLPPIGLIAYIFLGRNWKVNTLEKKGDNSLKNLIKYVINDCNSTISEYSSLIDLIAATSGSPVFKYNEVQILDGGKEKFHYLKDELLKAKHSIHLEYYIVNDDNIGNEIKNILITKAKEGIKIRFIIDSVGSIKLNKKYIKDLKLAGVEVIFYNYIFAPILRFIYTQVNYRNHRKIVVIDNCVSFVGGINIGDEYLGKGNLGNWHDCHIMIKGDASLGMQSIFLDDYSSIKKNNHQSIDILTEIDDYFCYNDSSEKTFIQLVKSGPDSPFPSILQSIIKMISMAKEEINIITPYFIPPEGLIDSLRIASLSGVKISIIFPEQSDHFIVNRASKTFLAELLRCNAKVYLYNNKEFIHSKILTVDKKICTIGTANLDIRSFELNYEINAVLYDQSITKTLNSIFLRDLSNCREFTLEEYNSENTFSKLLNGLSRLFSSIL